MPRRRIPLGDRPIMAIGIPAFGLAIPLLTGLYGPLTRADPAFWIGAAGFVGLAAAIWLGNRWLLLQQRRHLDWFERPARKLMMLVAANVLYTAPLTLAWISAWYLTARPAGRRRRAAGGDADQRDLRRLRHPRLRDRVPDPRARERHDAGRAARADAGRGRARGADLADRSALPLQQPQHPRPRHRPRPGAGARLLRPAGRGLPLRAGERGRQLVSLQEELDFVANYYALLALRFGRRSSWWSSRPATAPTPARGSRRWRCRPCSRTPVKHNRFDPTSRSACGCRGRPARIRFAHEKRPRSSTRPGTGVGLANLDERCRLLTGRGLASSRAGGEFAVTGAAGGA
jgi:hypothetical protein